MVHVFVLRLLFGLSIVSAMLPTMDVHESLQIGFQVAHLRHHFLDLGDSVDDVLSCLGHTHPEAASSTAPTHHPTNEDRDLHHGHRPVHHTDCAASVWTLPARTAFDVPVNAGTFTYAAWSADAPPLRYASSIFQPPRAS